MTTFDKKKKKSEIEEPGGRPCFHGPAFLLPMPSQQLAGASLRPLIFPQCKYSQQQPKKPHIPVLVRDLS